MKVSLLEGRHIYSEYSFDAIEKYGKYAAPTDLAVILGGSMTSSNRRTYEGDLCCTYWTASPTLSSEVRCISSDKDTDCWIKPCERSVSVRPYSDSSEAFRIAIGKCQKKAVKLHDPRVYREVYITEYGEYPQTAADEHTSEQLEKLHKSRSLSLTGKNYTFDEADPSDCDTPFKAASYPEYIFGGKKYIRILGRPADSYSRLSSGEQVEAGKPYWVQVQPIEWLVDYSGAIIAKKCLLAGIQFDTKKTYNIDDYLKTSIKHYLDTYFVKEMAPAEHTADREETKNIEETKTDEKASIEESKETLSQKQKELYAAIVARNR